MIDVASLEALEDAVGEALDAGDHRGLDVLGYGEISTVLRVGGSEGPVAAKRLPVMSRAEFAAYRETVITYLDRLRDRSVTPVETTVMAVGSDPVVPYCVQPLQHRLLVDELREAGIDTIERRTRQVVDAVAGTVDDRLGLDGQISNWAVVDDALVYLDVTTPLVRDESGSELLDVDLFLAALPWALRGGVRRFMLDEILSHYYDTRAVLLDCAGNLHKERLESALDPLLTAANTIVDVPLTPPEAAKYYTADARTWALLLGLRRADRWWQLHVRRRRYPFLLPGSIER